MTIKDRLSVKLIRGAKVVTWDGHTVTVMQKFKKPFILVLGEKGLYTITEDAIRRVLPG